MTPKEIKLNMTMNRTMLPIDSNLDRAKYADLAAALLVCKATIGALVGATVRILRAMENNLAERSDLSGLNSLLSITA